MSQSQEVMIRRLENDLGDAHRNLERTTRELNTLKNEHELRGRNLDALRGATHEMVIELERFLDNESGTIYDLRTALAVLRGAR